MPNGKIYDPLIGQWMSPQWETILDRLYSPRHLHPYRFNGNDPINAKMDTRDITGTLILSYQLLYLFVEPA